MHFDLSKKLSFFCVIFVNAHSVKVGIFFKESSMYMVIVMEYFPKGHLGNVVQNARDKKQPIPEEVSTGTFSIICAMKSTKTCMFFI